MSTQTIVWVALPGGLSAESAKQPRLSVFVSPRLQPDGEGVLSAFDFVDWPARLMSRGVRFEVRCGSTRVRAAVVSETRSDLWAGLFEADLLVLPEDTPMVPRVFATYPMAAVHDQIRDGYREACTAPRGGRVTRDVLRRAFPHVAALDAPSRAASPAGDARRRLARGLFASGSARGVLGVGDRLVDLAREEAARRGRVGDDGPVAVVPGDATGVSALEQFALFAAQPRGTRRRTALRADDGRLDFHQVVSMLGEYPALSRLLGLVVDLELESEDLPEASDLAPGAVRVSAQFDRPLDVATAHLAPETAYVYSRGERFRAASLPAGDARRELVEGLLDLRQPARDGSGSARFRMLQVDVHGAAQQLLAHLRESDPEATADGRGLSMELPPLRDAGLSLACRAHAESLLEAMASGRDKMRAVLAGGEVTFFAEDLMRGYRVDVRDATSGTWRSLHAREGRYRFLRTGDTLALADEGWSQPSLVRPPAEEGAVPDDATPHFTPESLFLWNGWSLAVPRPSAVLPAPVLPAEGPGASPTPPRLEVVHVPSPRSLPRLRFGEGYEFRVRAVDLAGNGPTLDGASDVVRSLGASAPVLPMGGEPLRFRRLEPVGAPVVVPRATVREGESLERLVIRSTAELDQAGWNALHPEHRHGGERHFAPPRTFQLMAEMLGRFDPAIGGPSPGSAAGLLDRAHASPETAAAHPEAVLRVGWLPDPLAAGVAFRGLPGVVEGTVGRIRGGVLEFSSMPDTGDSTRGLVLVDFGSASAWPDLRPFRLVLLSGRDAPRWDDAQRELSVFLEPGTTRTVQASCYLRNADDLSLMAIGQWVEDDLRGRAQAGSVDPATLAVRLEEWRQRALLGQSALLTPDRPLTLVHAVPQPVEAPRSRLLQPYKLIGQTWAYVRGTVTVHAPSTGRLELVAEWTEPHEEPGVAAPPQLRAFEAPVFPSPLALTLDAETAPGTPRSSAGGGPEIPEATFDASTGIVEYLAPRLDEFHAALKDLHRRMAAAVARVRTSATALPEDQRAEIRRALDEVGVGTIGSLIARSPLEARWPDVIPLADAAPFKLRSLVGQAANDPDLPAGVPQLQLTKEAIADLEEAAVSAGQIVATVREALRGRFRARHEFGDTRHRTVRYRAVGTARFGGAFPASSTGVSSSSEPVTVDILSSARPAPPKVGYLVPTFSWARTTDGDTRTSRRTGGGVRVYLERPWFSSGEGELLAVVLDPAGSNGTPSLERFVTRWGRDPVWRSSRTSRHPALADFSGAALVAEGLALPDPSAGSPVTVVAYPVEFHEDGRCYCDVELAPGGAYWPFVRLALARYQPSSVPTVELSDVVLTDFVQLAPDRVVQVVQGPARQLQVTLGGPTHVSPSGPLAPPGRSGTTVRVALQQRIEGATDEAGWIAADGLGSISEEPEPGLLWKGRVEIAGGLPSGNVRLLIQEFERYDAAGAGDPTPERVVFAETIEL